MKSLARRPADAAVVLAAGFATICAAWQLTERVIRGGLVDYVGGIWLALADDVSRGVLYRDLSGPLGYGATRYFPFFFVLIGALIRVGLSPLAAGLIVSSAAMILLALVAYGVVRELNHSRAFSVVFTALITMNHLVQRATVEVRADVLAVAMNLWGLGWLLTSFTEPSIPWVRLMGAALFFSLAFATKITSVAVPAAVVLALLVCGRLKTGIQLAGSIAAGYAAVVLLAAWASSGRAIETWRVCLFAGIGLARTLEIAFSSEIVAKVGRAWWLWAILAGQIAAIAAAWRHIPNLRARPRVVLAGTLTASTVFMTMMMLASPGTGPANQTIEWIACAAMVFAIVAAEVRGLRPWMVALTTALVLWAGARSAVLARGWATTPPVSTEPGLAVVERVRNATEPVLSEMPLWPILAGRIPYLIDPFAFKVAADARPDIRRDLVGKLDRQYFEIVVLGWNPHTPIGEAIYRGENFGWDVIEQLEARYDMNALAPGGPFLYVRKSPGR